MNIYVIYGDIFLLQNSLVTLLILLALIWTQNSRKKLWFLRAVVVSLVMSVLELVGFTVFYQYQITRASTIFIMFPIAVDVVLPRKGWKAYMKNLLLGYILTFFLEGGYRWLLTEWRYLGKKNMTNLIPWVGLFIVGGGLMVLFLRIWNGKSRQSQLQLVKLSEGERTLTIYGYYDSGNVLTEPIGHRPVHIISDEIAGQLQLESSEGREVTYHSLAGSGRMKVYEITGNGEKIMVGVTTPFWNTREYQMIINREGL